MKYERKKFKGRAVGLALAVSTLLGGCSYVTKNKTEVRTPNYQSYNGLRGEYSEGEFFKDLDRVEAMDVSDDGKQIIGRPFIKKFYNSIDLNELTSEENDFLRYGRKDLELKMKSVSGEKSKHFDFINFDDPTDRDLILFRKMYEHFSVPSIPF